MTHRAVKVIIITEKLIQERVAEIIEAAGASGYTVVAAGGKGGRGVRTTRPPIADGFANVKIEVITASRAVAERIVEEVTERYFANYSGITYLEEVEILRPHKF